MKKILFILLVITTINIAYGQTKGDTVILIAKKYLWVRENEPEGRRQVLKFLKAVKINYMTSWCAAFVSYILDEANVASPNIRTALAQGFLKGKYIPADKVLRGEVKVNNGSLVVWKKGTTIFGHVGIVTQWGKRYGKTIEGNTSPKVITNIQQQYNGDGVYARTRVIQPANYFRIIGFKKVS